jgi:hypothetical protein
VLPTATHSRSSTAAGACPAKDLHSQCCGSLRRAPDESHGCERIGRHLDQLCVAAQKELHFCSSFPERSGEGHFGGATALPCGPARFLPRRPHYRPSPSTAPRHPRPRWRRSTAISSSIAAPNTDTAGRRAAAHHLADVESIAHRCLLCARSWVMRFSLPGSQRQPSNFAPFLAPDPVTPGRGPVEFHALGGSLPA